LGLSGSKIGSEGGQALAQALHVNQTLIHLDLSESEIGVQGAHALVDALRVNQTLTDLDLRFNLIDDQSKQDLTKTSREERRLGHHILSDLESSPEIQFSIFR
jgi:hypothetical protein